MQKAVEYLIEQLQAPCRGIPSHIIEQANKMFEQQILDAFEEGSSDGFYGWGSSNKEQYYNKTYGSNGSDNSPKVENKDSFGEISDEEIEALALTFAEEESYGEFSGDLWRGYVFGAKRMRDQLKSRL